MKFIAFILAIVMFSSAAFADCDWSKIVSNPDGTYTYSKDLHICVGKLKQDNVTKTQQLADLTKAVDLYKVTIQTDEQRIQNWIATSMNLESHVEKIDELQKKNQWLYFGLGVAATMAAAYTMSKATGH